MRSTKGMLALVVGIAGFGAVAYASFSRDSHPGSAPPPSERSRANTSLSKPKIGQHPNKVAVSSGARFTFSARGRSPRFQCRLDGRRWAACQSPLVFSKLAIGIHGFSVRTVGARSAHGRAARFRWRVLEPKDFSITPQLSSLGALYPGAPAQALPLTISNPNPVPIFVTSLQVRATASPPGCPAAENLILSGSSASSTAPVKVPAGGAVSLPAPGATAPAIQLRDLPVNQDACQRTQFPLAFAGTARG